MDQLHVAAIGLRVAIEHAVADALDLALKKADVPLVRAQTNIVTVGETNFKMVAAGGDDVSRGHDLLAGERPEARRDRTVGERRLRQHRRQKNGPEKPSNRTTAKQPDHHPPPMPARLRRALAR